MGTSCPHVVVVIHYTYKLLKLLSGSWWLHIFFCLYFLSIGFTPSNVTQKPKYSISVCPKKDFSILHLSTFALKLFVVDYNSCTLSIQSPFDHIKISSMYARIS